MDGGKKVFFMSAFLILATLGAYLFYGRGWGAERALSALEEVKGITLQKLSEVGNFIKENTGKTFEKGIQSSYSFARRGVGEGIISTGEQIENFGTRLGGIGREGNSLSTSSATSTTSFSSPASGFFSPSPLYALVGIRATPVSFFVRPLAQYTVEWGDGTKETGEAPSSTFAMLTHAWVKSGDYVISLSFEKHNGKNIERVSIPIRIYETR